MVKTFLGAAAMAAMAHALVPAHAAKVGFGCSGENLAKTEGAVEIMADGPAKSTAQREIAAAQDAMLKGSMSGCAVHLGSAMRAGMPPQSVNASTMGQAPFANTMAEAPAERRQARPPAQMPLTPAL